MAVAIGTIALAIGTFMMVRQSNSQLRELRKQNALEQSKNKPILKTSDFRFKKNIPEVLVRNTGSGPVMWVGIYTKFFPAMKLLTDSPEHFRPLKSSEILQAVSDKKQLYQRFELIPNIDFQIDGETMHPAGMVNFQKEGEFILNSGENKIFSAEIKFELRGKGVFSSGHMYLFEELKEFLKKNQIQFVAIEIGITGKDSTGTTIPEMVLAKFYVDVEKHDSLESAYAEATATNLKPHGLPLTTSEIPFLDLDIYKEIRGPGQEYF